MTRRCKRLVVLAIGLPLLPYLSWVGYIRLCCPVVQDNTLIGESEAQLRESYGEPVKDWQGYQPVGLPPDRTWTPQGTIRTLVFHPRGFFHPEGGTLWVWLRERDGEWVCFGSCWFKSGVVLD